MKLNLVNDGGLFQEERKTATGEMAAGKRIAVTTGRS
jgi:hypothetical protein